MKKSLSFLSVLFFFQLGLAQNLVPNPSFEVHDTCPSNQDQFNYVVGWQNFSEYSPDYFNSCNPCTTSTFNCFSVPYNWGGYQQATTGNAYAGIYTFETNPYYNIRECIGAQLITPMIIGTKYYASFKTNLALNYPFNTATDKLGILFSTTPYNPANPVPISNFAHVYSNQIISDTANWTTIKGSIIADSAYKYVIIGNFFNDANTNLMTFFDSAYLSAYYYIDDIYVSTDSVSQVSNYELKNNVKIYPNPLNAFITIEIDSQMKHFIEFTLNDMLGNEIKKIQMIETRCVTIPISDLSSGIYLLKVKSGNNIFIKKLIISH